MQTSGPGSNTVPGQATRRRRQTRRQVRGFTLLELMVVVAIVAIMAGLATLALPNPASYRLEREGARLIAILEAARAEARAGGITVLWIPKGATADQDYQFLGLPAAAMPELTWMERGVRAQVVGSSNLVLGPEPVIGAQQVVLSLDDQQRVIATDGLSPFADAQVPDEANAGRDDQDEGSTDSTPTTTEDNAR